MRKVATPFCVAIMQRYLPQTARLNFATENDLAHREVSKAQAMFVKKTVREKISKYSRFRMQYRKESMKQGQAAGVVSASNDSMTRKAKCGGRPT
jgi:hypothetical protein